MLFPDDEASGFAENTELARICRPLGCGVADECDHVGWRAPKCRKRYRKFTIDHGISTCGCACVTTTATRAPISACNFAVTTRGSGPAFRRSGQRHVARHARTLLGGERIASHRDLDDRGHLPRAIRPGRRSRPRPNARMPQSVRINLPCAGSIGAMVKVRSGRQIFHQGSVQTLGARRNRTD